MKGRTDRNAVSSDMSSRSSGRYGTSQFEPSRSNLIRATNELGIGAKGIAERIKSRIFSAIGRRGPERERRERCYRNRDINEGRSRCITQ